MVTLSGDDLQCHPKLKVNMPNYKIWQKSTHRVLSMTVSLPNTVSKIYLHYIMFRCYCELKGQGHDLN